MNQPSRRLNYRHWRRSTAALACLAIFATLPTRASTPEQASIDDILGNSSELLIRRSGRRESAQTGSVLQQVRDALVTVPPNNARALLRFLSGSGDDLNMYMQTNPHPESAIYYFPCQVRGGDYIIGWGLARNESRGCETGLQVVRGGSTSAQLPNQLPTAALESPPESSLALANKQLAQAGARQIFWCSTAGSSGSANFATSSASDPCTTALQDCPDGNCEVLTTGFWWTNEEQLQATLSCANDQSFSVTGTGESLADQIPGLLQQGQGQACSLQVLRPQDFVIVPAADEVVTAMGDDEILVQTRETADGLRVDVLKGAINVRSTDQAEPRLLRAGERYVRTESGSTQTTFDRNEALTSIDMEVLCAFASYPENDLNVSACNEANLGTVSTTTTGGSVAFCDREQASGGQEGDQRTVQMGSNRGEIEIEYEMYGVPDRLQIVYEGKELLNTGFVSGNNRVSVPFEGKSGRVEVIITGNQQESGTQWDYTLYCP